MKRICTDFLKIRVNPPNPRHLRPYLSIISKACLDFGKALTQLPTLHPLNQLHLQHD